MTQSLLLNVQLKSIMSYAEHSLIDTLADYHDAIFSPNLESLLI
jgi:hypothetical protein